MPPFRRAAGVLAAVALTAVALLVSALPGLAAVPEQTAYLRLAHLSPDTPPVDVYVGSVADPAESFVLAGVGYGAVSPYQMVGPGPYVIGMRVAGAPADSPPVISTIVETRSGAAYTVAGVGMSAELGLSVLDDRLDMPAAGRASVRVINAAVSAPIVDCGPAGEPPWARDVSFGTSTGYADVPLGTWNLEVTAAGRPATALPVTLESNSVYSVLLVDGDDGVEAVLHRDSAGSATVPVGGVETGLGGAATPPSAPEAPFLVAAVGVALTAAAVLSRMRRSARNIA